VAPYLILALFLIGIWGLVRKDNLIKKVIALNIVNSALIVLFVYLGSLSGSTAPILVERLQRGARGGEAQSLEGLRRVADFVDPLPQALMLTDIVIGICLTALALTLAARIYRCYGTLDIRLLEKAAAQDEGRTEGDAPGGGPAGASSPPEGGPEDGRAGGTRRGGSDA